MQSVLSKLITARGFIIRFAFIFYLFGLPQITSQIGAQQKNSGGGNLTFDVVSIRKNNGYDVPSGLYLDTYKAINRPLWQTISYAYFPMQFHDRRWIKGAPSWVFDERYDVIAKIAPADVEAWKSLRMKAPGADNPELQAMFQRLLEDRCELKVHRVPMETDGYELVANSKIKLAPGTDSSDPNATAGSDGGSMVFFQKGDDHGWIFHQESITALLSFLVIFSGEPIQDKTNIKGKYDFTLEIHDEQSESHPEQSNLNDFMSVQLSLKGLGLELRPAKVSVNAVVIDHIERPAAN